MAIDTKHPLYTEHLPDWQTMLDCYAGERAVKEARFTYLPATSGMIADGALTSATSRGGEAYNAYRTRAQFPDLVSDAVKAMIGVMHHKPPTIELPSALEPLREQATLQDEGLDFLLRRINEQQLVTGRCGLLADLPLEPDARTSAPPYLALYKGKDIINWDAGHRERLGSDDLNLVVLDETGPVRQEFDWTTEHRYRVLMLGETAENEPSGQSLYRVGVFAGQDAQFSDAGLKPPSWRGKSLDFIPFSFINASDIVADPTDPPLLGLARLALTIYRGEADYRQALFLQGQDTLVVIGGLEQDNYRVGAGASISLPVGADAKFIGANSSGIPEMRTALENDQARATQKGSQLLDSVSRERESGEALKIRVAARTATLNQVALAGAGGLQQSLRHIARWMEADPKAVNVRPNLDFTADTIGGKELIELATFKQVGGPLSWAQIHRKMADKGVTELTYEEELAVIEAEVEAGGTTNPLGPEDD